MTFPPPIESAARIWGIKPSDITDRIRTREVSDARMAVALLCRLQGWPDGRTAKLINRTRCAANYAILAAQEAMETNPKFRAKFQQLCQHREINNGARDTAAALGAVLAQL